MSGKSLLVSMEITTAGRAHNCRYNKRHRIEKGVSRLTVKSDGDEHHYCIACARTFMAGSLERLRSLQVQVEALAPQSSSP
jgi:hypothetical protein